MKFIVTIVVNIFLLQLIGGCGGFELSGGAYSFSDTAMFYAPKSKVRVIVYSKGQVAKGADLGVGKGLVELTFTERYTDTLRLLTSPENIDTIIVRDKVIPFSSNQINSITFYNFLDSMGFKGLDNNEISELRDAMTLINYGHKAGFAEGQTKYIRIEQIKKHSSFD